MSETNNPDVLEDVQVVAFGAYLAGFQDAVSVIADTYMKQTYDAPEGIDD